LLQLVTRLHMLCKVNCTHGSCFLLFLAASTSLGSSINEAPSLSPTVSLSRIWNACLSGTKKVLGATLPDAPERIHPYHRGPRSLFTILMCASHTKVSWSCTKWASWSWKIHYAGPPHVSCSCVVGFRQSGRQGALWSLHFKNNQNGLPTTSLYGTETWTIWKEDFKRIEAFEMWMWRRVERSWTERKMNELVLKKVEKNVDRYTGQK